MNSVNLTGRLVSEPEHRYRAFTHVTEFDVEVPVHKRRYDRFHVVAHNDLACIARRLPIGVTVAVVGTLRSEAYDMPDRSIWYKTEILAHELDRID
jgi:single-stranded DNA-binding protein